MKGQKESLPSPAECQYRPLMMEDNGTDNENDGTNGNGKRRKQYWTNDFGNLWKKFLFLMILVGLMLLVGLFTVLMLNTQSFSLHQKFLPMSQTCSFTNTPAFRAALAQQKRGMARILLADGQLDVNGTWALIPQHYNQIWSNLLHMLDVLKLQSDGEEFKYFIVFSPNGTKQPARHCTFITLGVGHTVNAERNLTQLFPACRLITADPAAAINANLTRDIGGTFVHAAVGGETATGQPVNFWGKDVVITRFVERKLLPQIGIVDFLNKFYHQRQQNVVDLLLIDIEGAEFGILEQLADHYDTFPVAICQMNIEVHDPAYLLPNYTHQMFYRSFDRILRQGHFALMHTDMYTGAVPLHMFLRMFLVNVDSNECARKFLC